MSRAIRQAISLRLISYLVFLCMGVMTYRGRHFSICVPEEVEDGIVPYDLFFGLGNLIRCLLIRDRMESLRFEFVDLVE